MISQILFLSVQVIHKPAKKCLCETIRLCEMMLYGNIFPILFFSWFIVFYQLSISNQIKQYTQGSVVFFFLPSQRSMTPSVRAVRSKSQSLYTNRRWHFDVDSVTKDDLHYITLHKIKIIRTISTVVLNYDYDSD